MYGNPLKINLEKLNTNYYENIIRSIYYYHYYYKYQQYEKKLQVK